MPLPWVRILDTYVGAYGDILDDSRVNSEWLTPPPRALGKLLTFQIGQNMQIRIPGFETRALNLTGLVE